MSSGLTLTSSPSPPRPRRARNAAAAPGGTRPATLTTSSRSPGSRSRRSSPCDAIARSRARSVHVSTRNAAARRRSDALARGLVASSSPPRSGLALGGVARCAAAGRSAARPSPRPGRRFGRRRRPIDGLRYGLDRGHCLCSRREELPSGHEAPAGRSRRRSIRPRTISARSRTADGARARARARPGSTAGQPRESRGVGWVGDTVLGEQ